MLNPELTYTFSNRLCVAKKPGFESNQPFGDCFLGLAILWTEKPLLEDRRLAQFEHV